MAERNQKIFDRVRQELVKNATMGSRELYELAKRVDGSIGGDTLQQFHARYVLPLKREQSGPSKRRAARKGKRAGKAKRATATTVLAPAKATRRGRVARAAGSERDRARAVLLRFAQDFSAAETKTEIVKVMSRLDDYVNQLSPNGG